MSYRRVERNSFTLYINEGGKVIGTKNVPVIEQDGYIFKDFERSGKLHAYADWRLDYKARAEDLAKRLTTEEMVGLMLHSSHQQIPALPHSTKYDHTYSEKPYLESGCEPWTLSDQQIQRLKEEHLRHFLAGNFKNTETAIRWNNNLQELAEQLPHSIPVNISSDPRHGVGESDQEFKTSGLSISKWPEGIGLAATFSTEICKNFADIASKEYRALGIATALGPQIDLGTEPRWARATDSMGGHATLSADIAKAYCDGMQTTKNTKDGWGTDSVITMAKHWPGGGTGEGGRDAHYAFGKYAIYPGGNFEEHLKPFLEGAMALKDGTEKCAAIMPYYSVSWDQDKKNGQNVGNAYSEYIVKDLLRDKYKYDGVVCTDWGIEANMTPGVAAFLPGGKCHGVEELSIPERFLMLIMNDVNQFGDVDQAEQILEAYKLGCEKYGQEIMNQKFHNSAVKILTNMFRVGLFENPYLDIEESIEVLGCEQYVKAGYEAQLASVVMLKNKDSILPLRKQVKVYVPDRHINEFYNFIRLRNSSQQIHPIQEVLLSQYFIPVKSQEEAEVAIIFVDSPFGNGGYDGGYLPPQYKYEDNGYEPISLQYRPYTATSARVKSVAGGDPREDSVNRSYYKKTAKTANESDLDLVIQTKEKMGEKPVIVCIRIKHAAVLSELEPYADVLLVDFGVQKKALLDIITGAYEPSGLLPMLLPKNMETVEKHCEDVAFDMESYVDSQGNTYSFGFGMNFTGQIIDVRTDTYKI